MMRFQISDCRLQIVQKNKPCRKGQVGIAHLTALMHVKGHFKSLWLAVTVLAFVLSVTSTTICAEQKIFSTWEGFEADKLASIWLIKRFIAPGASVVLYPKGHDLKEGIPFDTPHAEITRKFNKSTFESFLEHYRIKDKKLINIGRLIHDIEINTWERKLFKKTREVEIRTLEILEKYKKNEEILARAYEYFDHLYSTISVELEQN